MATSAEIRAALDAEIAATNTELALAITANLVEATPVDTGHARANWIPGLGNRPTEEVPGTGSEARDAGIRALLANRNPVIPVYVTNNVPYIGRLIAGSSSQAPAGWDVAAIDAAVAEVQARHDALKLDVSRPGGVRGDVGVEPR